MKDNKLKVKNSTVFYAGKNWHSAEFYKGKGVLKVEDDVNVRTIDEACKIFGIRAIRRGFAFLAAAPIKGNQTVWCPCKENTKWDNEIIEDNGRIEIHETRKKDNDKHIEECLALREQRITFFKWKYVYHFVGVFEIDENQTKKKRTCVWHLAKTYYKLL